MLDALKRTFTSPGVPPALRFVSRAFVRWPLTVIAVVLTGLVTYSQISALQGENFSVGTAEFGEGSLQTEELTTGDFPVTGPSPSPTPGAKKQKDKRPSPGAPGATPTASPGTGGGGGGGGGTTFVWNTPKSGAYRYDVSGGENVNITGGLCRHSYDRGNVFMTQQGDRFQSDLEYVNDDGTITHRERRLLKYSAAGVEIDVTAARVQCIQNEESSEDYEPDLMLFKFPLKPGATWAGRANAEERDTDYTAEVLRTETVAVEGRNVTTYVVRTRLDFTGSQTGTRIWTWWFAPTLGMPVKWTEETNARRPPATFTQNATWTLVGLP